MRASGRLCNGLQIRAAREDDLAVQWLADELSPALDSHSHLHTSLCQSIGRPQTNRQSLSIGGERQLLQGSHTHNCTEILLDWHALGRERAPTQ